MTPNNQYNSINSNSNNNSRLIIVSKGRLVSAKENINYITLQEGELKLTMQVSNNSLNKKEINKALNNIRSQNFRNSKSNANLNVNLKSKEKKYYNILLKEKNKNKIQLTNIETTTTKNNNLNNFIQTTGNNKNENKKIDKVKLTKLKITSLDTSNNEENKNSDNDDVNNDIIINQKIEQKNIPENKKNELKIQISDIINVNNNIENENSEKKNKLIDDNPMSSKEIFIEGKNELKKKLSSQEMSINNNEFEELKHLYIDSSRSKENTISLNNNLIEKSNQKTKLSKNENKVSKSELITINNPKSKGGVADSAVVNVGDSIKGNYIAQNLITEMEGDEISNKDSNKIKDDLISDDKTIKVEENEEEYNEEKEKEKNKEIISNNDLTEKKSNENINIINYIIKNDDVNNNKNINKNKKNNNENKNTKFRSLNCINIHQTPILYKMCQICEHTLPGSRLFCAKCYEHFLCKKCTKNFYEDKIESGVRDLVCPMMKCRIPVEIEELKNFISNEHYNILTKNSNKNQNYLLLAKLKTETVPDNVELYTEKHVLDIDTNKKFFSFNNMKDTYCSNCNKDALFTKANSHFSKCLYCECKKCKFCSKEFNNEHLDLNSPSHCKVFYRYNENDVPKPKLILKFLMELFFVFANFFISLIGTFLLIRRMFFICFKMKKNKSCFKYIFLYLFTIICFLIVFPFIYIFFPVFPSILAFFEL